MATGQVAVQQAGLRGRLATALVIGAFAVGVGTGAGVLRTIETRTTTAPAPAVVRAASLGQTMSDAAYAAMHPTTLAGAASGSLGQTMSDAAYAAMHPATNH
jgi:hypothetical protein